MAIDSVACIFDRSKKISQAMQQFARFLLVGGSFAVIYILGTTLLLEHTLLPAWTASALVYGLCIPPAYLAQKLFAFQSRDRNIAAFPRYVILQFGALLFASATAQLIKSVLAAPALFASIASISIGVVINFILLKLWVLSKS